MHVGAGALACCEDPQGPLFGESFFGCLESMYVHVHADGDVEFLHDVWGDQAFAIVEKKAPGASAVSGAFDSVDDQGGHGV